MQEVATEKEILQAYRLSPQQERLWRVQQDMSGRVFRAVCAVSSEGPLDQSLLKDAMGRVVQRHDICRTSFQRRPELRFPIQVINDSAEPFWQIIDLCDEPEQEARIDELFSEETEQPLDLDRESLLRATLIQLSRGRNVLIISLPSLCADRRTLRNIVNDLARIYETSSQIEEEVTQYVEFSEWQHELFGEDDAEAGKEYWTSRASLEQPTLPLENKAVAGAEFVPEVYSFTIDTAESEPQMLLACWQVLLSRLTAHTPIVIGYLHDGRNDEALSDACGPLAKRLPIVAEFSDKQTFSDVVRQVRRSLIDADKWQDYFVGETFLSFGFDFEKRTPRTISNGLKFSIHKQYVLDEPFKVGLSCAQSADELHLELHYDANLYQRDDIARLAEEFRTLVSSAVVNPDATLDDLPIVGAAEQQQIVVNFNDTAAAYPTGQTVHELFEARVEVAPDAIAVEFEDQQFTYAELNTRANQLAHYLRGLGVGPDVLVAVIMERSVEMAVGLLAIIKEIGRAHV